jgi:hypothetical protein
MVGSLTIKVLVVASFKIKYFRQEIRRSDVIG